MGRGAEWSRGCGGFDYPSLDEEWRDGFFTQSQAGYSIIPPMGLSARSINSREFCVMRCSSRTMNILLHCSFSLVPDHLVWSASSSSCAADTFLATITSEKSPSLLLSPTIL